MTPKRTWEEESSNDNRNTIIIQNQNVQENAGCNGCLQGCGTIFGMFLFLGFILALTEKFGPVIIMLVGFFVGVCGGAMIHGFITGNPIKISELSEYLEVWSDDIDANIKKEWKDWDPELKQKIYWMMGCGGACAIGGLIYAQSL